MTDLLGIVSLLEQEGGKLTLDGDRVRYSIPKESPRAQALLGIVRKEKQAIIACLRTRMLSPGMPPGVRLVEWNIKEPPVAIETCEVVVNTALFAKSTFEQLRIAIANPKRSVGWTIPQLIDRLAQVGVLVALDTISKG